MSGSILITRGQDQGRDFAADLEQAGFKTCHAPMIEIVAQGFDDFSPAIDALIITSANALKMIGADQLSGLIHMPIFTVGVQTKRAAKSAGFKTIHSADGDVSDLVTLINQHKVSLTSIGYLRGKNVSADMSDLLSPLGIAVQERVCYAAKPASAIASEAVEKMTAGEVQAVTFFSKRTAKIFFKNMKYQKDVRLPEATKYLCISAGVLECVRIQRGGQEAHEPGNMFVADTPNRQGMIKLVQEHCNIAS